MSTEVHADERRAPQEILALTLPELSRLLHGSGRARTVWASIRRGEDPFTCAQLSSRARARLAQKCLPPTVTVAERITSECGTAKLLLRLADGHKIESVLIPGKGRSTVCISTQVGCSRGCRFCATAKMGLVRQLNPAEMVAQVMLSSRLAREEGMPPLRNVVLMGMGEPLDNLNHVEQALLVLTDPLTLAVPPRHITISSVGPSPEAIRAARQLPGRFAWSLHAVDDDLRRRLIPSARHPVRELKEAFLDVARQRRSLLFVEMTLVDGWNDSPHHARALADFLRDFHPDVRVNLLPANIARRGIAPSPEARVEEFQSLLRMQGYFCITRRARGIDARAACGQLATRRSCD